MLDCYLMVVDANDTAVADIVIDVAANELKCHKEKAVLSIWLNKN